MTDRAAQVEALSHEAARLPEAKRADWLDEACGDDADLRAAVEQVLAELEAEQGGDEDDIRSRATVQTPRPPIVIKQANLPKSIGQFSVRRLIGTGGMGAVYEAMQENPRRKVAVKVMKRGITSDSAQRRFHLEAQLLGRLHHPGIAQIYEAGTWDDGTGGVPFFAMEYIAGAKELIQYADDKGLDVKQKMELFADICDAVHHGHQKGIIHRDLKPGNILIDRGGNPKVIDFGVARSTDSDLAITTQHTDVGALIGTLQYMSPEQCEADPDIIDTRSDVYSLGVMLYELLSGKSPYDLGSMAIYDAAKVVREQPATRLSVVSPVFRGDLETIVSKAMAKDPDYRYQSCIELKQDLERYGRGEPISARPLSLSYQMSLLIRRNKPAVVAAGVVAGVLVVATVLSIVLAVRASSAEVRAVHAQALSEAQLENARVGQAFQRDILAMSSPRNAQGRTLSTQHILIEAAAGIDERFDGLPELAAETRLMVGELMFELQMFDEADRQLTKCITALEVLEGKDDPRVIQAMAALSRLWSEQGRANEADTVSAEALTRAERVLPADDPVRIEAQWSRVLTLEMLTRYDEAVVLSEAYLDAARRRYGKRHEMTIEGQSVHGRMLLNVGALHQEADVQQRMQSEGYALVQTAADVGEAELGAGHPVTLQAVATIAFIDWARTWTELAAAEGQDDTDQAQQQMDDAEQHLSEVIAAVQRVLGEDHTFVLDVLHQHGRMLVIWGIFSGSDADLIARGDALLERSHAGYLRRVGPDHPLTHAVEVDRSQARLHLTGQAMGVDALRTAYDRLVEIHHDDHHEVIRARALLAMALLEEEQLEQGEPLMRQTVATISAMLGPLHSETIGLRMMLAKALIQVGQIERGLAEGDAMLAESREGFDDGEVGHIRLWKAVGDRYGDADRHEVALSLYEEAADAAIEHLKPTSSTRANVLAAYVKALLEQEQPEEALVRIDDAIAGYAQREDAEADLANLLQLFRLDALFQLDRGEEAQAAFTELLHARRDPIETLSLVDMAVNTVSAALVDDMGAVIVSVAESARDTFEPDNNKALVWRDAVIARLHNARGDLAKAVQWQERAVEVADRVQLDKARETLEKYQTALAASDVSEAGP